MDVVLSRELLTALQGSACVQYCHQQSVVSQLVEERLVTITVTSSSDGEVPTLQLMRVEAAGHCCV